MIIQQKSPFFPSKEWALASHDITSVTQLPFKWPVILRPILSNSLPLSITPSSALERLSKIHFSISHIQLYYSK